MHDPWSLVTVTETPKVDHEPVSDNDEEQNQPVRSKPKISCTDKHDIVRMYVLSLSPQVIEVAEKARADAIA